VRFYLKSFRNPQANHKALARAIGVSPRRINEIVLGKRTITADTELRLARYYKISEGLFLGLQTGCDLRMQRRALGIVWISSSRERCDDVS
jgi:antitoxin HigA-1